MVNVNLNNLSNEIAKHLVAYTNDVTEKLEEAKKKVAKDGVKRLKETSPKDTGAYAKSWSTVKRGSAQIIRNKNHYQLTHLLEKGHAKRGGGRVPPKVHIKPVEEMVIKEFEKEVERALRS